MPGKAIDKAGLLVREGQPAIPFDRFVIRDAITERVLCRVVSSASAKESKILDFDTMIGIPSQFTGPQALAAFRNIPAGGLPWTLTSAKGQLKASGELEIEVKV